MRNTSLLLGVTFALFTLVGCGSKVETGPCTGADCPTGSGGGVATSTGSTGTVGTGGASSTSSVSSSGVGGGALCGGFTGAECAANEYCDYTTNGCGFSDDQGMCKPRPQACDKVYAPACGCDGKVYGNSCEASAAGIDINDKGGCKAPMGTFACGSTFCGVGISYCRHSISDIGGEPSTFDCLSLPALCGNPATCACLDKEPCGSMCSATPEGGLILVCPGG